MRLERGRIGPLLDDDKSVGPELGLDRTHALGIDGGPVFDAALLGMHGRHVGAEFLEDRVALAGLGGDDGDDVDHGCRSSLWRSDDLSLPRRARQGGPAWKMWRCRTGGWPCSRSRGAGFSRR